MTVDTSPVHTFCRVLCFIKIEQIFLYIREVESNAKTLVYVTIISKYMIINFFLFNFVNILTKILNVHRAFVKHTAKYL